MDALAVEIRAVMEHPYTDMCYAASEAYYHLAGASQADLTPVHMPEPDGSTAQRHWALRRSDGSILDLTVEQFGGIQPDYGQAKGCGFMTRKPSKRAATLIAAVEGRR